MPLQLDTVAPLSPGSPETWLVDTPSGAVLGVVVADGKRRSLLMREPLPRKRIAEPPSFGPWKEGAEWTEGSGTRYVEYARLHDIARDHTRWHREITAARLGRSGWGR